MTEKEIQELIAREVKKAIENQPQKSTPRLLEKTHTKWFRDETGAAYKCKMNEVFYDTGVCWQVWENIRVLTTKICGAKWVRDIAPSKQDEANRIADYICQQVYDLKKKFNEESSCKESEEE